MSLKGKVRNLNEDLRRGRKRLDLSKQRINDILSDSGGKEGMDSNYAFNHHKFEKMYRDRVPNEAVEARRKKHVEGQI